MLARADLGAERVRVAAVSLLNGRVQYILRLVKLLQSDVQLGKISPQHGLRTGLDGGLVVVDGLGIVVRLDQRRANLSKC